MLISLGVLTVFALVLFFGCDTGTNGGGGNDGLDNLQGVKGTFASDVPEGTGTAILAIDIGNAASLSAIPEKISGTIRERNVDIPIAGTYDTAENFFVLSGGAEYLKYYVEGAFTASFQFTGTTANVAISASKTDDGWDMKAKKTVTPQP
jgi:hypothetical protein